MAGDDLILQVLIELGVDANKARQGATQINAITSGLQNAQKQADHASSGINKFLDNANKAADNLTKTAEKAAKAIAVVGGGLFGASAAAASAYGQKFQGVEAEATRIVAAQKAVETSFLNMGRITSRFVAPALETLADVIQAVVEFLDSVVPREGVNPLEDFIKNKIPEALEAASRLVGIVEGVWALARREVEKFGVGVESFLDRLITGLQKAIGEFLGKFFPESDAAKAALAPDDAAKKRIEKQVDAFFDKLVSEGVDPEVAQRRAVELQNKLELSQLDQDLADRENERLKRLKEINDRAKETGDKLAKTDEQVAQIKPAVEKTLARARSTREGTEQITKEFVDAYIRFRDQVKAADQRFAAGQADAAKTFNEANAKAQESYNEAVSKLDADFMDSQIKATRAFRKQEEKEQTAAAKERVRILRDLEARLTDLAAARDVAGFIQAQRDGKRQLDDQKDQADDAAKERMAAFQEQQEEAQENYQKQRHELRTNLDEQLDQNRKAYNEQLALLRQKHSEEKQAAMAAYAEQLAMLEGSNAQLNATYAAHYARMSAEAEAFVARNQATLNKLYQGATGTSAPPSTYDAAAEIARAQQTTTYQAAAQRNRASIADAFSSIPRFHSGGVMPFDGLARLRKGEVITPPEQRGISGQPNITIQVENFNYGRQVTHEDLADAQKQVVKWVAAASNPNGG